MGDREPLVVTVAEAFSGGVARHLAYAAQTLPSLGWRLHHIVSPGRPHETPAITPESLAGPGSEVEILPMVRAPHPWRDSAAYRKLRSRLAELRPALVHSHSAKAGVLARMAARSLGIPAVHTPHVLASEWADGIAGWLYVRIERFAGREAWMACLTESQAAFALSAGLVRPGRVSVVANGIEPDRFAPASMVPAGFRRAARRELGVDEDDVPVVGTVARMARQKGVDDFLEVVRLTRAAQPRVRFLWAGEGPLADAVARRAEAMGLFKHGTLRLLGNVPDMQAYYAALDFFVLTSRWEGMPYALLEARAAGLPTVATETWGSAACVEHGRTGLLVPVGVPEEAARAVLGLLRDPARASRLGESAAEDVRRRHTLTTWALSTDRLYREILSGRP